MPRPQETKTPIHTTAPTKSTLTPSVMQPLRGGCSSFPASGNSGRRDELDGNGLPVVPDSCADMSSKSLFITASLTPLDGKPISCAMTRRSSTFSALSCVQSPFCATTLHDTAQPCNRFLHFDLCTNPACELFLQATPLHRQLQLRS